MQSLKKLMVAGAMFALLAPAAVAMHAPTRARGINHRQRYQARRIRQGVRSGQLTRPEAARLWRRQAGIRAREARMRASGGQFTRGERRAIQRQLNRNSRWIARQKHDYQRRW
jgi:hypothetical protein